MSRTMSTADPDKVYRVRLRQEAEGGNRVLTMFYGPWQTLGAAKACITRENGWSRSDSYWTNTWTVEVASEWSTIDG